MAAVADVAGDIVTLSLPDERLSELSHDPSWIAAHRTFSQGMPRVRHLFGDSRTTDVGDYENWADVLFIDGDHGRNGVESDTRRFWDVRRRETGVVVWHDAFLTPLRPRWEVLAGIAAGLPPELRRGLVHVSNTLCVVWLPESHRLSTVALSYVPRIAFTVSVALHHGWQNARESHEVELLPAPTVAVETKTGESVRTGTSVSQHKRSGE
ncbi:MAG: class I SAM-dependent methyltransferase [Anaerolineae bacterium]|nr:class I SAM-dependent methyltransferase [Gemmatimonadaceae bacterium]